MKFEEKRREKIKAGVLQCFLLTGKDLQSDSEEATIRKMQMKILTEKLTEEPYPVDHILSAITEHSRQSKWEPHFSDLIKILDSKKEKNIDIELENRWNYFLDFAFCPDFYRTEPLEDWAYDIKKSLGAKRIEQAPESEIVWIKKEFMDMAERQLRGQIEVYGDTRRNWVKIGGRMQLQSPTKSSMLKLSDTLASFQIKEA